MYPDADAILEEVVGGFARADRVVEADALFEKRMP